MANAHLQIDGDPLEHAESLIAQGDGGAAADFLRAHLAAGRGGLLARLTLVRALLSSGQTHEALKEAREASSLNPGTGIAALALGEALLQGHYLPAAIGEFQRALRLDPDSVEARFLLGSAWLEAGEADRALEFFHVLPPETPGLQNKIAAAESIRTAPRSDAGYVRHLFDQFSADYDNRMRGQLAYAAPEILRDLADMVMPGREGLAILDLGCGTGLVGEVFRDRAAKLDGVDLSPAMVEKAKARDIYDRLTVGDLETALEQGGSYDLILAADTLVYLGDLGKTFTGAARSLAPDGYFLFTVERSDGEAFHLGPKRRWRHAESYLRQQTARAGLDLAGIVAAVPRTEANHPVEGFAVALHRPA